ncbi:hypothetical protein L3V77_24980 [Vibrio sp. DW001]|uniref:hypothetical protein n=1 Tax=Vibrio sp. DW001 TaxID=2912315 RepID=UPI0023AF0C8B|nr:hypothetical protein [Vibrio sp. DW001]WED29186.1 hypothetical protein L3V77_24980 [Vibrio sp. DW001]
MCIIHSFKKTKDTGVNAYYECKKCGFRKVKVISSSGYQPIDLKWLRGEGDSNV